MAHLLGVGFLLEGDLEVGRSPTQLAQAAPELLRDRREPLRAEHDQRNRQDQGDFPDSETKHDVL